MVAPASEDDESSCLTRLVVDDDLVVEAGMELAALDHEGLAVHHFRVAKLGSHRVPF
jgi:hypothetical protein